MKITPEEIYAFRRLRLDIKWAALKMEELDLEAQEMALAIDKTYNLLDKDADVSLKTGEITIKEPTTPEKEG